MRVKLLILLGLCGLTGLSCGGDDERAPRAPAGGANADDGGPRAGTGGRYVPMGGRGGDDEDAGPQDDEDGGAGTGGNAGTGGTGGSDMGSRCRDVDPVPPGTDPDPGMVDNVVTLPDDLAVTRASAAWEDGCIQPSLRVTISDGNCPDGDGHQVTFFLPANEDNPLLIGQNLVTAEPSASNIRVRYTRPTNSEPSGVWGTCSGANGTLDIIGELEFIAGREVQGSFILDLTRCDGGEDSVQQMTGSFRVEIPASLSDVCP
jgi:hypothetical protein